MFVFIMHIKNNYIHKNNAVYITDYAREKGVVMVENKDPIIKTILEAAKTNKFANTKREYVFTNAKSIYAALERKNTLKNRE